MEIDRHGSDERDGGQGFGLSESGAYLPGCADRVLCCASDVQPPAPADRGGATVEQQIYAQGLRIDEFRRGADGRFAPVPDSPYRRRITLTTVLDFAGPARGSALLATKFSGLGTQTRGTPGLGAGCRTPWGTYLGGETGYLDLLGRTAGDDAWRSAKEIAALRRYGLPEHRRSPRGWELAGSEDLYARWNSSVRGATAADDYRNAVNTFGWVVEIDPFNRGSVPAKHTALGRRDHMGIWIAPAVTGRPIVVYLRDEYLYKFVSRALWNDADVGQGMSAGAKYLGEGRLHAARLDADGRGAWLELAHGRHGLAVDHADYPFADQAEVLIHARLAADCLGATRLDQAAPARAAPPPADEPAVRLAGSGTPWQERRWPGADQGCAFR